MDKVINQDLFTQEYFALWEETFETHHGIFLDKGTSLFETLSSITAEEASIPVGGKCATLAAQVTHVNFYLELLENYILKIDNGDIDWGEIWRTVKAVTPQEWISLQVKLKETYQRIDGYMRALTSWGDETTIGGAMAMIVHTAYHLGEIRQALCTLK